MKIGTLPASLNGSYFILANVISPTQTVMGVSKTSVVISPQHIDLGDAITSVPAVARLGGKISVALDVTNGGNETAKGTLAILFELSTASDGSNPVQVATLTQRINIKAGKSKVLHLHVPVALGAPSGNQFIAAVLDPANVFNDTNLANNTAISTTPVSFR